MKRIRDELQKLEKRKWKGWEKRNMDTDKEMRKEERTQNKSLSIKKLHFLNAQFLFT